MQTYGAAPPRTATYIPERKRPKQRAERRTGLLNRKLAPRRAY